MAMIPALLTRMSMGRPTRCMRRVKSWTEDKDDRSRVLCSTCRPRDCGEDLLDRVQALCRVPDCDDDLRPYLGELLGGLETNPAGGSGDDGQPASLVGNGLAFWTSHGVECPIVSVEQWYVWSAGMPGQPRSTPVHNGPVMRRMVHVTDSRGGPSE